MVLFVFLLFPDSSLLMLSHCLVAEMWCVPAVLAFKLKTYIMGGKLHPWHVHLTSAFVYSSQLTYLVHVPKPMLPSRVSTRAAEDRGRVYSFGWEGWSHRALVRDAVGCWSVPALVLWQ